MDVITLEERYLKMTKRFAKLSGLWPYQSQFSKYLARVLITVTSIAAIITQMADVCFVEVTIEGIPFMAVVYGIIIKQWNFIINEKKFKLLLNIMYEDWMTDKSKEEIDIMTIYAKRGAFFISFYVGNAYICVFAFVCIPHMPTILDKISPLNESRSRLFIYPAYYWVDEEKYYYFIMAHMSIIIIFVLFVYATFDTAYVFVVQHACGLLAVSGYRFKQAVENYGAEKSVENYDKMYKKVCFAIQGHTRAILYVQEIENMYFSCLLLMMCVIMTTLSITLVKMSIMNITVEFYKYCSFLIIQLMHLFFLTIQGQFLINSNNKIYDDIYEAPWYNAPAKTQRLYVLGLKRALSPLEITAGGFVTMNLQSFSQVIKTSVSYFTVLQSTQ